MAESGSGKVKRRRKKKTEKESTTTTATTVPPQIPPALEALRAKITEIVSSLIMSADELAYELATLNPADDKCAECPIASKARDVVAKLKQLRKELRSLRTQT